MRHKQEDFSLVFVDVSFVCNHIYIHIYICSQYLIHFTKYCYGDQIKKDEMGRACSNHERDAEFTQNFGRKI
jgi:hypothetical protein